MSATGSHLDYEAVRRARSLLDIVSADVGHPVRAGELVHCIWPDNHANGDKKPSMAVYDDHVFCFSEHRRGDVVDYWAATRAVSSVDAARQLAGGELPTTTGPVTRRPNLPAKPSLPEANPARVRMALQEAWHYYSFSPHHPLIGTDGQPVQSLHARAVGYLAGRGLDVAALEAHVGYPLVGHTPAHEADLVERLAAKGFLPDELLASGLAVAGKSGDLIDTLRRRVVFPVRDEHGVIGFIGRRDMHPDRAEMSPAEAEEWAAEQGIRALPPKYMNTPSTVLCDKSTALYWPVGQSRPGDRVVVVEGVVDALATAVASFEVGRLTATSRRVVPVAASGKGVSQEHWAAIGVTQPSGVAIGLDTDAAGDTARLVAGARRAGIANLFIIDWRPSPSSPAKDPAEVLELHGAEAVAACWQATKPLTPRVPSRPARPGRGMEMGDSALPASPSNGQDLGLSA